TAAGASGPQGRTPVGGTPPGGTPVPGAAGGSAAGPWGPATGASGAGLSGLGTTATHVTGAPVPGPRPAPPAAVQGSGAGTWAGAGAAPVPVLLPLEPASARATPLDARDTALALPVPLVDAADPNAGFLTGLLASAPGDLLGALSAAPADSAELRLRELRARLELGELPEAGHTLAELEARHPDDWRVVWARGIASLATGDDEIAALSFDAIYDAFPGEPAPKLALGLCAEVLGQLDNAAEYYRLVWITDPGFVSAAFGLARVQLAAGDRDAAVRTLESVPEASIHYTAARVAAVRARLRDRSPQEALLADLAAAADQVEALRRFGLDPERQERLRAEVLGSALDWVLSGSRGSDPGRTSLLGSQLDERGLRFGLERSYRVLARLARRGEERIELVERANRFRPRTWV
ncbi:tetratricopeptide repeat protein, partial [Streptomyces sp. NPDC056544]